MGACQNAKHMCIVASVSPSAATAPKKKTTWLEIKCLITAETACFASSVQESKMLGGRRIRERENLLKRFNLWLLLPGCCCLPLGKQPSAAGCFSPFRPDVSIRTCSGKGRGGVERLCVPHENAQCCLDCCCRDFQPCTLCCAVPLALVLVRPSFSFWGWCVRHTMMSGYCTSLHSQLHNAVRAQVAPLPYAWSVGWEHPHCLIPALPTPCCLFHPENSTVHADCMLETDHHTVWQFHSSTGN